MPGMPIPGIPGMPGMPANGIIPPAGPKDDIMVVIIAPFNSGGSDRQASATSSSANTLNGFLPISCFSSARSARKAFCRAQYSFHVSSSKE